MKVKGVVPRLAVLCWGRAAWRRLFHRWGWFFWQALKVCGMGIRGDGGPAI